MSHDPAVITRRICELIVERLELEDFDAESFPADAVLFAPEEGGGLGLDSIASLEIASALSDEYDLELDEIAREDFVSAQTLGVYIARELEALES